jgi:hypothetical protein
LRGSTLIAASRQLAATFRLFDCMHEQRAQGKAVSPYSVLPVLQPRDGLSENREHDYLSLRYLFYLLFRALSTFLHSNKESFRPKIA